MSKILNQTTSFPGSLKAAPPKSPSPGLLGDREEREVRKATGEKAQCPLFRGTAACSLQVRPHRGAPGTRSGHIQKGLQCQTR